MGSATERPLRFTVVTLFPESFQSLLGTSLLGKAIANGLVAVDFVDPRDFSGDRHRTVDDTPFGGGEGMVLKVDPFVAAMESVPTERPGVTPRRVLLTPQGAPLSSHSPPCSM